MRLQTAVWLTSMAVAMQHHRNPGILQRGLQLAPENLRVAVNDEFGDWRQPLAEGDTVVFLPPVAGG